MTPPPGHLDSEGVGVALAGAAGAFAGAARTANEGLAACGTPELPRSLVVSCGPRALPAGDALVAVAEVVSAVPVQATPHTRLPAHVGPGSLVAVVALGPHEVRLVRPAVAEATRRGARVLVVTAGGEVAPADRPAPAAASTAPSPIAPSPIALAPLVEALPALLAVAGWSGVLPAAATVVDDVRAALEAVAGPAGRSAPAMSAAGDLARRIGRAIPLFEGSAGVGAVAAGWWRRSWNLLAKAPAFAAVEPEATLSEVVGFGQHGDVTRQLLVLVSLRTAADAPEDRARSALFAELAGEALAATLEVAAPPPAPAGALAHLAWLGAATAHARALQEGLDPGPAPAATEVEARVDATRHADGALA